MFEVEELRALKQVSLRVSQLGLILCRPTEKGYMWICEDHGIARQLCRALMDGVQQKGIDTSIYKYRFHPEPAGHILIVELSKNSRPDPPKNVDQTS